ncbi:MAG: spore germination protein [Thermoanaerobacteraceae bacterium]|jgi:spore germination protein KC|nr:spore germination protein [Thermoanaerobacteraceae bacterium]
MSDVDLIKPKPIKSLERRQATVIRNEIEFVLKKAREWGVDIFGFGETVHRKYPEE